MKRIIQFKRKVSSNKNIFTWERTSTQEINSLYGTYFLPEMRYIGDDAYDADTIRTYLNTIFYE